MIAVPPRPLLNAVLCAAVVMITAALWPGVAACAPTVGFQHLTIADGDQPPIEVGIWYPAAAPAQEEPLGLATQTVAHDAAVAGERLPLVVVSHGNGGSFAGHADTAQALARAGFVVAALSHTGDTYRDQSRATDMANRPRLIHVLIDYMLSSWPDLAVLDPARIGAFGFSSGGFTVLVAAGAIPDLSRVAGHCRAHPDYYDCRLVRAHGLAAGSAPPQWIADPRIKAVVAAAPALGFAFGREGLAQVRQPVQLWRAQDDHILPHPDYAEAVRLALPQPPESHVVAHADHFDFLGPCSAAEAARLGPICASEPGFDRVAFHADFNAAVIAFFRKNL